MKNIILILTFLASISNSYSQVEETAIPIEKEIAINLELKPSPLSYAKELPKINSYLINKNTSGSVVSEEILKMVNYYRRADEDYLWVVSSEIEILVLKFNQ